jgi:acetolactate synthase-1/2/3 large subunit
MNGGAHLAEVLVARGVKTLFTLCGGHIAPILVEAKRRGIRVVDGRHEVTAAFAADATARLTGVPGVAAVTAGPGVTNTITALKNAQMAESPLVLLGGATATMLKGRGSLQDIDQLALVRPHVKWARSAARVRELGPLLGAAFDAAQAALPGPAFLECPVDLLYEEAIVREWYGAKGGAASKGLADRAVAAYLARHVNGLFAGSETAGAHGGDAAAAVEPDEGGVREAAALLQKALRPVLVVGSQAVRLPRLVPALVHAIEQLGVPTFLSGMARGLLGAGHPLQMRQRRKEALREADLVLLAGVPCDFRMDYGRHIPRRTPLVSVNLDRGWLKRNRRPTCALLADPAAVLVKLAGLAAAAPRESWAETLRERDRARDAEIAAAPPGSAGAIDPVFACRQIEGALGDDSVLVADGGDFVSTASYVLRPRRPLSWLDPGVFGTLGVGAGFAIGAATARPGSEVFVLYGDGSLGYSLAEFDTYVRHGLPVIAIVGNDASWMQIAREQVEVLKDDVGTVLRSTDYHLAAEGLGGRGIDVQRPEDLAPALAEARRIARSGQPVLVNVRLGRTEFRKGSISM